jgi:hypothetical protein
VRIADNTPENIPGIKYLVTCAKEIITPPPFITLICYECIKDIKKATQKPTVSGTPGFG